MTSFYGCETTADKPDAAEPFYKDIIYFHCRKILAGLMFKVKSDELKKVHRI